MATQSQQDLESNDKYGDELAEPQPENGKATAKEGAAAAGKFKATTPLALVVTIDSSCPMAQHWPARKSQELLWTPETFSESAQANWSEQTAYGRSQAWQSYSGTGSRTWNFDVTLHAEVDATREVLHVARWFLALQYPFYASSGRVIPPATVLVKIGDLFDFRAKCDGASVSYEPPFDIDFIPHRASLSLTFTEMTASPPGVKEILAGQY